MPRPPLLRVLAAPPTRPYICRTCSLHLARRSSRARAAHTQQQSQSQSQLQSQSQSAAQDDDATATSASTQSSPSLLALLTSRGFVKDVAGSPADLDRLLSTGRISAYAGIDPTAPSLHLGHLLPFMLLFWLYVHGHHAVSLIGGATAKIGDPTGRLTTRTAMDGATRGSNVAAMDRQVRRLWENVGVVARKHGFGSRGQHAADASAWKRSVLDNDSWLGRLSIVEFLGLIGRGARLGTMIGRDTVKNKMSQGDGMSFAEFSYPLLQAWDWWHMYKTMGVQLQIGGSDQYGNIIAGMDAIKNISALQSQQHQGHGQATTPVPVVAKTEDALTATYGITTPLLTTSAGTKFGKSAGNAVWLDPEMTSPFDLYGFLVRSSDTDVQRYLQLFTFVPLSQIAQVMVQHAADPGKRLAQHLLAREVLELVHGDKVAAETETRHRQLRRPTLASLTASSAPAESSSPAAKTAEKTERVAIGFSQLASCSPAKLIHLAELAPTRSAATRLVNSGGAYMGMPANLASSSSSSSSSSPTEGDEQGAEVKEVGAKDEAAGAGDESGLIFRALKDTTPEMIRKCASETGVLVLRVGKWRARVIEVAKD